jgi:hypothetical protein
MKLSLKSNSDMQVDIKKPKKLALLSLKIPSQAAGLRQPFAELSMLHLIQLRKGELPQHLLNARSVGRMNLDKESFKNHKHLHVRIRVGICMISSQGSVRAH